ncbi:hypothetical protein BO224_06205 [Erysipelotrichaceae bacterium NYU-BL-E8]|uniref:Type I restriction modification DNA specificity domain-containing protein n=1 Tax=Ileibacterium valens TaxID=1862668 RepID=A0A1U7NGF3_9FIRM|nr:hypothetical protein BM735_06235 [Erysipelotrichaceae bacterium NYU-BL-F16]OLU40101.1 hypothetical protein BO224_06205 [Erysipelotrichaceae bacterium NYU-BL-E8]OLU40167.1 hypothetical protein BO222_05500 [Ileibacterium valens]
MKDNTVNPNYIGCFFNSEKYRQVISESSVGVNNKNIRNSDIDEITIPLPDIKKQDEIVDKINKVKSLIQKKPKILDQLSVLERFQQTEVFNEKSEAN